MSTATTTNAWKVREETARLQSALVAHQKRIKERLLRYREDEAPPGKERLPQGEAARRADVDVRQWQRWESGQRMPHPSNLEKLAENLSIPPGEFFADAPTETETPELLDTLNGEMPDDLQAQLDRIESQQEQIAGKLDAVLADRERLDRLEETVSDLADELDPRRRQALATLDQLAKEREEMAQEAVAKRSGRSGTAPASTNPPAAEESTPPKRRASR